MLEILYFSEFKISLGISKTGVYKFLPIQEYTAYWQGQQVSVRITYVAETNFIVSTSEENVLDILIAIECMHMHKNMEKKKNP